MQECDRVRITANVFDATEAKFETEVIQASLTTPVLVDFWAAWCGPCKTLGPILEKVVASYNGAVKLAKVDTDAQMQLAAAFGIRSLPTVVLVKDGQMIDGFMGAVPEPAVREFLQRHVKPLDADAVEDVAAAEPMASETPEQAIARLQQQLATNARPSWRSSSISPSPTCVRDWPKPRRPNSNRCRRISPKMRARNVCATQLEFSRTLKDAPDEPRCVRASRKIRPITKHAICSACDCCSKATRRPGLDEYLTSCALSETGTTARPRNA